MFFFFLHSSCCLYLYPSNLYSWIPFSSLAAFIADHAQRLHVGLRSGMALSLTAAHASTKLSSGSSALLAGLSGASRARREHTIHCFQLAFRHFSNREQLYVPLDKYVSSGGFIVGFGQALIISEHRENHLARLFFNFCYLQNIPSAPSLGSTTSLRK